MASTITMGTLPTHTAEERAGIGTRFLDWLVRVGERSPGAHAARAYARLNALSDDQLAALGLKREDLLAHCFRHVVRY